MGLFGRKKKDEVPSAGRSCPFCGNRDTRPLAGEAGLKTWRGQRSAVYRCFSCSRDFYEGGTDVPLFPDDDVIENEDALLEAEEEIRKQMEDDDDRRFPRHL